MNAHRGTLGRFVASCFIAGLGLDAAGDLPGNHYALIPAHNPFRLREMVLVEPVRQPELPALAPLRILLTGIFALSRPKALLQIENPQTKTTEFPPPLAVGDSYHTITIVAINAEDHTVNIKDGNAETILDFINHGVQPKPVAPVPPSGAVRLTPYGVPVPAAIGGSRPNSAQPLKREAVVDGGRSTVPPPMGVDANGETPPGRTMTREEVDARIGIEREIRMQNNDSTYKLLPPAIQVRGR